MKAKEKRKPKTILAGIDIGSSRVRVLLEDEGLVFDEPCVLAVDRKGQCLAIGEQAWQMRGLSDDEVRVIRPLENNVVNFPALDTFLEQLCLDTGIFRMFKKTVIALSYPTMLSSQDVQVLKEHLIHLGAEKVYFDQEILFSALGSRIDLYAPVASGIMNIGHENCEIAVYAKGQLIEKSGFSMNGQAVSRQITGWFHDQKRLLVSEETVESIKENLGGFIPVRRPKAMEIRGISMDTHNLESAVIDENQIAQVLEPILEQWAIWITAFLEALDPSDRQDIIMRGIVACGGCLKLRGLASSLSNLCGLPIYCTDEPSLTVIQGLSSLLQKAEL
ncbi:rod shape-determining protein [Ileibacterium valens]|uniref:rod shape-determining protein n=1 Tax=Ileibacterium valens TaxID=1862668 RepID=UPI0025728F3C|nr:rod shape-determining protein [Ileibacterium valens]